MSNIIPFISIHSPHAGRDPHGRRRDGKEKDDFNPLSPCGERHQGRMNCCQTRQFQSTLPMRGETSPRAVVYFHNQFGFQSTLPMRGETIAGADGAPIA